MIIQLRRKLDEMRALSLGTRLPPDFEFATPEGKMVKLSDFEEAITVDD